MTTNSYVEKKAEPHVKTISRIFIFIWLKEQLYTNKCQPPIRPLNQKYKKAIKMFLVHSCISLLCLSSICLCLEG